MDSPRVSIVIPVFNRAHLVSRAIDSALAQTVECEVILVDHGSKDDISAVVAKYGTRIKYIRREADSGPILAWRDGAESASGEYLHFTYDDDWLQPTFVEKTLACFKSDIAFVYTRATLRNTNTDPLSVLMRHPPGGHAIDGIVQCLLSSPLTISPGCAMFRRKDVLKNLLLEVPGATGIYGKNSGVGEDLLLFLLTSLDYERYAHIPEALADFLSHSGSITVNARNSGRNALLVESYRVAKIFYLNQPDALQPLTGFRKILFHARWVAASLSI